MNKEETLEYFSRMHQILDLGGYNNAMIAGQHFLELIKEHNMCLSEIEDTLREMDSRIYLIGLPLSYFKSEYTLSAKLPDSDKQYKYALWVELNGKDTVEDLLVRNSLTDVDRSLNETGFLLISSESLEHILDT